MSAQHTPAPWEFGEDRRWLFRDDLKADGVFSSTTILKIDDDAFRPSVADAILIAAAPELLEACESMLPRNLCLTNSNVRDDTVVPLETTMGELRKIAAAIARATGAA